MRSVIGDSSVLLWVASACIAFLGSRAFVEFLRRLHYEGPVRLWREWLYGSAALTAGLWSAMIIDIGAQGFAFEIGYHPLKAVGALLGVYAVVLMLVAWVTIRPAWPAQLAAMALAALLAVILQVAVVWSIGAEPGLSWQLQPLSFAALLMVVGFGIGGWMVVGPRRGSKGDRTARRLMAALVLTACTVAAQELVLTASSLDRQVVSAHARFLPEMVFTLLAGAAVPITLVLLLVDQRAQQRARASERARRRRQSADPGGGESMFSENLLAEAGDIPKAPTQR